MKIPNIGFWRTLLRTIARNPISFFAVICVAATGIFLAYTTNRLASVLESPQWCGRAIQAERISAEGFNGLTACVDLLTIQLHAVATGFHISVGSHALTLLVLIIVVIAGAKASGKIGASGVEFDVGKDADEAADAVANAAVEKAEDIKAEPELGPHMPEPKP